MSNPQKPKNTAEAIKPITTPPSPEVRAWQDQQVRDAIAEADAGDFATAEEVKAIVRKFVPNG